MTCFPFLLHMLMHYAWISSSTVRTTHSPLAYCHIIIFPCKKAKRRKASTSNLMGSVRKMPNENENVYFAIIVLNHHQLSWFCNKVVLSASTYEHIHTLTPCLFIKFKSNLFIWNGHFYFPYFSFTHLYNQKKQII